MLIVGKPVVLLHVLLSGLLSLCPAQAEGHARELQVWLVGISFFFFELTVTTLPPLQRILIARIDEALQQSLCATPQVICLASVGRSPRPPREHAVSARGT